MFDDVARRYDITNDILSMGQDRRWRRIVLDAIAPQPGERVLDLAAGTGTSSQPFRDRGAYVVPCDFSLGMLGQGKKQLPALPFVAGVTVLGALVAFGLALVLRRRHGKAHPGEKPEQLF